MKKFILMAALAAGTAAFAEDYNYLTIGYNHVEKSITLESIQKITFENGNVVVSTSNGMESFPQSQLEKMFFSATSTNIGEVWETENDIPTDATYDLTGRRVERPTKGIYIINGKKVIIK